MEVKNHCDCCCVGEAGWMLKLWELKSCARSAPRKFPHAVEVVGVCVASNAHVVGVDAIELMGQLRYYCGVNGSCRRDLLPFNSLNTQELYDLIHMLSTQYEYKQHEVTACLMKSA